MRPVVRGECPKDQDGQDVQFAAYQQARSALIERLGECCSYCEMHLDASLAVEHVQPKKPPGAAAAIPQREFEWSNFLLACTNCNSTKGNKDVVLNEHLWPDRDDTFHALIYSEGGVVDSAPGMHQPRADRLVKLVGLHVKADTAEASDRRWSNRREAWDMAVYAKSRLARCPLDAQDLFREQIMETAQAKGFWSVWMTVFADDPAMRALLLQIFPGTNTDRFNR